MVLTDVARVTLAFLLLAALGLMVMPVRVPWALRRCGIGLAVVQALVTIDVAHENPGLTTAGVHHQVPEGLANHVVPSLAAGLLAWILILVGRAWRAAARELRAAPPRRR